MPLDGLGAHGGAFLVPPGPPHAPPAPSRVACGAFLRHLGLPHEALCTIGSRFRRVSVTSGATSGRLLYPRGSLPARFLSLGATSGRPLWPGVASGALLRPPGSPPSALCNVGVVRGVPVRVGVVRGPPAPSGSSLVTSGPSLFHPGAPSGASGVTSGGLLCRPMSPPAARGRLSIVSGIASGAFFVVQGYFRVPFVRLVVVRGRFSVLSVPRGACGAVEARFSEAARGQETSRLETGHGGLCALPGAPCALRGHLRGASPSSGALVVLFKTTKKQRFTPCVD